MLDKLYELIDNLTSLKATIGLQLWTTAVVKTNVLTFTAFTQQPLFILFGLQFGISDLLMAVTIMTILLTCMAGIFKLIMMYYKMQNQRREYIKGQRSDIYKNNVHD